MKITLNQAITIITIACSLAGFYYTTQHRLDGLEAELQSMDERVLECSKQSKRALKLAKDKQ